MNCATKNIDSGAIKSDDIRKRNSVANKSKWKENVNKKKRMEGEQYVGISKKELSQKPPRQLGESCSSQYCVKSALRNCVFRGHSKGNI